MPLIELARKPLPSGSTEITLSDGTHRVTITVTIETEMATERQALYEVMFNREVARLSTARRVSQPGQPL